MRIFVACLASYNAGTLHGEWIDCTGKDWEMGGDIRKVENGANGFFVFDGSM